MTSYEGLTEQAFTLPNVKQPFLSGTRSKNPAIHIGLTQWSHPKWINSGVFPPRMKERDALPHYSDVFNSVELNATHYKSYCPEEIKAWYDKVKRNDFQFCPKFPKEITKHGTFLNPEITNTFLEGIKEFKEKLGPTFLMINSIYNEDKLFNYLKSIPSETFIEVRDSGWYTSEETISTYAHKLNSLRKGWIITDTPGERQLLHMRITTPTAFIRFVCEGDHEFDFYRIQQWKEVLSSWYEQGLEDCFFFLHVRNQTKAIDFAKIVQKALASTWLL